MGRQSPPSLADPPRRSRREKAAGHRVAGGGAPGPTQAISGPMEPGGGVLQQDLDTEKLEMVIKRRIISLKRALS